MKHVQYAIPSSLSTEDLVQLRTRLRLAIKVLENRPAKSVQQVEDLKQARAYLRELQKEAGKRFIQQRLF